MEVKSNIDKHFPINKDINQNIFESNPQKPNIRYSSNKKSQNARTYTFYQSQPLNLNQADKETNEKKQYRFVSEHIDQYRRKSYSNLVPKTVQNGIIKSENSNEGTNQQLNSSFRYQENMQNNGREDIRLSSSQGSFDSFNRSNQISFNKNRIMHISPTFVQSTVINGSQTIQTHYQSVSNSHFRQGLQTCSSEVERYISSQFDNKRTYLEDENLSLNEKLHLLEEQCKNLEKRNFDLAQQIMNSETILRNHEKKQRQMEDSIKISRNIITSLNERLARTKKENEETIENIKVEHNNQFVEFQANKLDQIKILQGQLFQLKMKIIDQNHLLEKSNENMKIQIAKRTEETEKRIQETENIHKNNIIELESTIISLNGQINNLQVQLVELEGQKEHFSQQNDRLNDLINEQKLQLEVKKESESVKVEDDDELKLKVIQLETKLRQMELKNEQFEDQLEEKDTTIAQLKLSLTKTQLEIIQQKKMIRRSSKVSLQDEESLQVSRINQIHTLKDNIVELQNKLKQYEFKQVDWQSKIVEVIHKMEELSKQYIEKLEVKQKSISMLSQIIENKEQQLNTKESVIGTLTKIIQNKDIQLKEAKQDNNVLNEQFQEVVREKNQIKQYIQQLHKFQEEMKALQPEQYRVQSEGELNSPQKLISSPMKSNNSDDEPSIQTPKPSSPETMQEWIDQIQGHSREVLIMKIQQLYFINKSLQMKVEDINDLQNNENTMVMTKLKVFEQNIEKYEEQLNELYEQNTSLKEQIQVLTEQCVMQDGKLEFIDNLYRQTQLSLYQTSQELIRAQIQLVNYRFALEKADILAQSEEEVQQNINEIDEMIEEMRDDKNIQDELDQIDNNYEIAQHSHSDCEQINFVPQSEIQQHEEAQQGQNIEQTVEYDEQALIREVQQQQKQLRLKLISQPQQQKSQQQNNTELMQQTSDKQIKYQIEENGLGDIVLSIKVSHVSSDSDQEEQEIKKAETFIVGQSPLPKKQQDKGRSLESLPEETQQQNSEPKE